LRNKKKNKKRRWWRWLGIALLIQFFVMLIAILGTGWTYSSVLLYPWQHPCYPHHFVYCGTPKDQGIAFQELKLRTSDGVQLYGWWMPPKKPYIKKAIIFAHGRSVDRRQGMRFAKALHKAGFGMVTFDFRNSGRSQKAFNSMGYHEQKDITKVVDFLYKKGIRKIGIFGFSMGAATGILAMAKDKRIDAGVFEASYADLGDALAHLGKARYGISRYPFLPAILGWFAIRGGLSVDELHPERYIARIAPRPILLMHGTWDFIIPPSHGERLYKAAREPKELWMVPKAKHAEIWQRMGVLAERKVTRFFQKAFAHNRNKKHKPSQLQKPGM